MAMNVEELKKRKEEIDQKRKDYISKDFFDIKDGDNFLRILPRNLSYFSKDGDSDFAIRYWVHYKLFKVDGYRMVVCLRTIGKECPVCNMVQDICKSDKKKAGLLELKAKERFIYNVWDIVEKKLKILETGPKIYEEVLKYVLDPEWGDLFGIKDGNKLTVTKTPAEKSSTGWVDYTIVPSPTKTDLTEVLPDNWDEEIDKLREKLPLVLDEKELQRLVECYKLEKSPVAEEQEEREVVKKERESSDNIEKVEVKKEEVKVERQECFGKSYSPRNEQCRGCKSKDECRRNYLKMR